MFILFIMIVVLAVAILLATGQKLEIGDGFTEEKKHARDADFTVVGVQNKIEETKEGGIEN